MLRQIKKYWKAHPLGVLLLLMGYAISILLVSVGASFLHQSYEYQQDATSGNPLHNQLVHVSFQEKAPVQDLLPVMEQIGQDVSLTAFFLDNRQPIAGGSHEVVLAGVSYAQPPEWQPPLLEGRQLSAEEVRKGEKVVVVGKQIANDLFPKGLKATTTLHLQGEAFRVIGVVGREVRETQWDSLVYLPLGALPPSFQSQSIAQMTWLVSGHGSSPQALVDRWTQELQVSNPNLRLVNSPMAQFEADASDPLSSVWGLAALAGLVLVVSMINMSNLTLFWILERREEIGIRKTVGATNRHVLMMILAEMISIALGGAVIALVGQLLLAMILSVYQIGLEISWINLVVAVSVALLCGSITSWVPARAALRMEPVEILKGV